MEDVVAFTTFRPVTFFSSQTLTVQDACFPLEEVAVISHFPGEMAVTIPEASTLAIFGSEEVQVRR